MHGHQSTDRCADLTLLIKSLQDVSYEEVASCMRLKAIFERVYA
jgi:hypothetical protein